MGWKCPKCQSTDLEVTVEVWATLHQTGKTEDDFNFETDIDGGDHEWDSNSPMRCNACQHIAISGEFNTEDQEGGSE